MSRRAEGRRAGRGLVRAARLGRGSGGTPVEVMEGRVLMSVSAAADTPFRIVAITGNQQSDLSARYPDETLFDVTVGTPGADPAFLDGFTTAPGAHTTLSTVGAVPGAVPGISDGITQGSGALRVDVPQDGSTFWGIRSPNIVDL